MGPPRAFHTGRQPPAAPDVGPKPHCGCSGPVPALLSSMQLQGDKSSPSTGTSELCVPTPPLSVGGMCPQIPGSTLGTYAARKGLAEMMARGAVGGDHPGSPVWPQWQRPVAQPQPRGQRRWPLPASPQGRAALPTPCPGPRDGEFGLWDALPAASSCRPRSSVRCGACTWPGVCTLGTAGSGVCAPSPAAPCTTTAGRQGAASCSRAG